MRLVDNESQLVGLEVGAVRRVPGSDIVRALLQPGVAPLLLDLLYGSLPRYPAILALRNARRWRYAARDHLVICLNTELEHVGHGIWLLSVDCPTPESLVVLIVIEGLRARRSHERKRNEHQREANRNDSHLILLMFECRVARVYGGTDDAVNREVRQNGRSYASRVDGPTQSRHPTSVQPLCSRCLCGDRNVRYNNHREH